MSAGEAGFGNNLRQALRQQSEGESHPSLESLEAFHWGDLPAAEADRVRAHLGGCALCLDLVARLEEIEAAARAPAVEVPDGELEQSLAKVRERLGMPADPDTAAVTAADSSRLAARARRAARPFPRWSAAPGPYALAAALLAVGIGLALWLTASLERERRLPDLASRLAAATVRSAAAEEHLAAARQQTAALDRQIGMLRQERDRLLSPQPNTPILDLRVSGERGAGGTGTRSTELSWPPDIRFLTLVLEDPGQGEFVAYRARFLDRKGHPWLSVEGLKRTEFRSFVISIARGSLPAREVDLLLEGRRSDRWSVIAEYRLHQRQ